MQQYTKDAFAFMDEIVIASDNALRRHGICNLFKARDIGPHNEIVIKAVLLCCRIDVVIQIHHDALECGIDLLKGPVQPFAVLGHFEGRGGNTASVGRLAGQEEHAVCLKVISCFCSRRHIGAFRHGHDAVCHQSLGILEREFVLRRTGKCYITLHAPYALTLMVLGIRAVVY